MIYWESVHAERVKLFNEVNALVNLVNETNKESVVYILSQATRGIRKNEQFFRLKKLAAQKVIVQ